jgi:hypothetical protein
MVRLARRVPDPLVRRCRKRMVANVDSMGLVVRRVDPMFGREVVEGEQHVTILLETFTGHRVLRLIFFQKGIEGLRRSGPRFGHPDLGFRRS